MSKAYNEIPMVKWGIKTKPNRIYTCTKIFGIWWLYRITKLEQEKEKENEQI